MTRITEKNEWAEGIYELRETDAVLGGADGISNRQAAQLAGRTQWLKKLMESHADAPDPHPQYRTATEDVAESVSSLSENMKNQAASLAALAKDLDGWAQYTEGRLAAQATPPGTQMLFVQSTAPLGWSKIVNHHDKVLRIVNGAATFGGSVAFSEAFAARSISGSIGSTTLTEGQMPKHTHNLEMLKTASGSYYATGYTGEIYYNTNLRYRTFSQSFPTTTVGNSNAHSHSLEIDAPDFNVQYVDAIIASRDADS